MGRRTYSAEKIGRTRARLLSNGGYLKPTAQAEEVSMDTVTRWADGKYPEHVTPEQVDQETEKASKELAGLWSRVGRLGAEKAIEALEEGRVSAKDAAIVGAIGTDKANLLLGKPTERVETLDLATFLARSAAPKPADRPLAGTNLAPEPVGVEQEATKPN